MAALHNTGSTPESIGASERLDRYYSFLDETITARLPIIPGYNSGAGPKPLRHNFFPGRVMRRDDFGPEAPGTLVAEVGPAGESWAYVPNPLPPPLTFSTSLVRSLSEADQALGELNGAGRMLPNPHLLIGPFLRREAVESSRIEGTITDLRQIVLYEADPDVADRDPDREEVYNYVRALEYGLTRLSTLPVSRRLMREVHGRLMAGVRGAEKSPGEFRDRQNAIGRDGQDASECRFVPPPVGPMNQALEDLERYVNEPSALPPLVDLAIIHYQFEAIHPFLDGNGRVGRLLVSLLLQEKGCLCQPLLFLSAFFERNRDDYVDHLLQVSREAAWEGWIGFFLKAVATQAREASGRCRELLDLWKGYREQLLDGGKSANLLKLLDFLFERPSIRSAEAARKLGITFPAAQSNIERLVALGILVEVTGKARDRIYLAPKILAIVQDDGGGRVP